MEVNQGNGSACYEPQVPGERILPNKPSLASSHRITPDESSILLSTVVREPKSVEDRLIALLC